MAAICYVTPSLYPVQSFGDWALEVWARASAEARSGHTVVVLWFLPPGPPPAGTAAAVALHRERGVELVVSSDLEPFLQADEVFGREPGLRLLPALRRLHGECRFDRIELPVADGLALRVVQETASGRTFDGTVVTVHLGVTGEWRRLRRRRLALDAGEIKRDFMERETVELAGSSRTSTPALRAFAAEIGWEVGHVALEAPPTFPAADLVSPAGPFTPCFLGGEDGNLETFLRWVATPGLAPAWLAVFPDRLEPTARQKLERALRSSRCAAELLGPRRWDLLPGALREKRAVVIHASGRVDARLRWLAAGRIPFVCDEDTADEIFGSSPSPLAFRPEEPASLARALAAAQACSEWPAVFSAVEQSGSRPTLDLPPPAEPARPPEPERVLLAVSHYNLGSLMEETLEALAAQDYPSCEVMVVDDGSTDAAALDAFRAMKRMFPAFRFVELPHAGYWSPRNFAIRECTAPYLIVVDGDNLPVPHMAGRFVQAMQKNTACAAFSSYVSAFREHRGEARAGRFEGVHAPLGGDPVSGHFENVYGDTNSIFRIEILRALGGFRENFPCSFGDWEIFHRLVGAGHRLGVVPEVLLHYRRRSGGMIRQSPLFPSYFELLRIMTPGADLRPADRRRLSHALHGLALPR